ncbi:MAG: acetate/propionate family kinase [Sphingomonadales bacterium]|nr:acetate/propionate family kinase [Sphingomonadales bacterium]MDE2170485.1 acetate/propionate family kinase [Sphingomonadales bacterium]
MKAVVSLNSGSSSIKFALYTLDTGQPPVFSAGGKIERIGLAPRLSIRQADGTVIYDRDWVDGAALTHGELLADLFAWAAEHVSGREIVAVGHRIVHGGTTFAAPCLVDDALLDALDALCPLAPLHQPHNLAAIRAIRRLQPTLAQVACFDTAFHHDKPEIASRLALPREMHEQGIRRYGFHGLSYEYIARRLRELDPDLASGRVITAHLGNGASLCAMHDGHSLDTTMGFTALDGLMMGTRCGSIDPGVVLHLQIQMGMSPQQVEHLLYQKSGLLGVSGISSDMRALASNPSSQAQEAIDLFAWRAARELCGLVASLGGIDGIVFTAGIGENDADLRRRICERLTWMGIELDQDANMANAGIISQPDARVRVLVIPTDEERMIALHTLNIVEGNV